MISSSALAETLRALGLEFRRIASINEVQLRDFIVTEPGCSIHQITGILPGGILELEEIHPQRGRWWSTDTRHLKVYCIFGTRPIKRVVTGMAELASVAQTSMASVLMHAASIALGIVAGTFLIHVSGLKR